ncbi:MAG: hypothetical protein WC726_02550 [Parcubacteria group bacterium]|jgi:cell division GTPase FtsZ
MNSLEIKFRKQKEAEARREMQRSFISTIVEEVVRGLQQKIEAGEDIYQKDIAEVLRSIVKEKIQPDSKVFAGLVFENENEFYDIINPFISKGIGRRRKEIAEEKSAA